jgi:hypothetical protein
MARTLVQINDTVAPDVSVDGPWAYAQRFNKAANATEYMAATPAKEDADTWLLLACGAEGRVTNDAALGAIATRRGAPGWVDGAFDPPCLTSRYDSSVARVKRPMAMTAAPAMP